MCTKSKERKYNYYDIKVINNLDGSIENINMLNEEKVDKSNYKQMLEVYRDIKEQYKDEDVTIDFCGVANDSSIKVLYKKELNTYNCKNNIYNLINQLNEIVNKIIKRNKYLLSLKSIYDSKEQRELHKIEDIEKKNIYEMSKQDIEKRLQIFNNIQSNRVDRRCAKEEENVLKCIKGRGTLTSLININKDIQKSKGIIFQKNLNTKNKCHANPEEMAEKLYKEVHYKDFKDRIRIMKELQKNFSKVIYDKDRKLCIGRNSIYSK